MSRIVKKVINKRKSGASLINATYSVTGEELRKKIAPPKNGLFGEAYFEDIRKQIYPKGFKNKKRLTFQIRHLVWNTMRHKLSKRTFGNGQFGIILIKPELLPFTLDVRKFLTQIGCRVSLSKVQQLNHNQIEALYQPEMHRWKDFPISAATLVSGPSRTLVFKHANPRTYIDLLKQTNPKLYQNLRESLPKMTTQELFHIAVKGLIDEGRLGTLRGDITHKRLKELGFGNMTGISTQFDPTGYLRDRVNSGKSVFNILTGIHSPETISDLISHGVALFTRAELLRIIRQSINK